MVMNLLKKNDLNLFRTSVFAGIAISFGCLAFLTMGNLIGPILFTFGLITVIHYKLTLYTGAVGFLELLDFNKTNWKNIALIILGNIIGCLLIALLSNYGNFTFLLSVNDIVLSRLSQPISAVIVRAMGCGLIMSAAVQFARQNKFLPLLFGVPLFIYCGFYHSIADTFYYLFSSLKPTITMVFTLVMTYFGNYLGCSAYKLFINKERD